MSDLPQKIRDHARAGQYGHSRTPRNFYMGTSYCSFYWDNHGRFKSHKEWIAAATLLGRYQRFVQYMTEVLPEWKEVRKVLYMDNSTEVEEVDRHGNTRRRQTVAPSGDACY